VKAAMEHAEPAKFHGDVRMRGDLFDASPPARPDLLLLQSMGADADRTANMIDDELRFGKRPRQIVDIVELMIILPGLEAETHLGQNAQAVAERRLEKEMRAKSRRMGTDLGIPHRPVPHASEPAF